jgi:ADP-ribosyl-[dinitrogen reductase] hydrolase
VSLVRSSASSFPSRPRRRPWWAGKLDDAEVGDPTRFRPNGYVVTALQAAHAAIHATAVHVERPTRHLADALQAAVAIGDDTDTVAAIVGQLVGARWGQSAIPAAWRERLHGWPGLRADDLARLARSTASRSVKVVATSGWGVDVG